MSKPLNVSPIHPLADRVVAVRAAASIRTASGLYLPETAKEKPVTATVQAVGPDVKTIHIGDSILYKEYSTTEITMNDVEYLILKEEDIIATV